MRCKNAPFLTSVFTPGCISWQIGFASFSNGSYESTDDDNFLSGGGQLVVRGTKHWYFESNDKDDEDNTDDEDDADDKDDKDDEDNKDDKDNEDDEAKEKNNRISMNWTDNPGGDEGEGTGDGVEAVVIPAPSPCGIAHRWAGR